MSSNSNVYTAAAVYVTTPTGTKLLMEEASVTINRTTNAQPVVTVQKGLAGFSRGAAQTDITVESAVHSEDFEMDPGPFMDELLPVKFTIFAAGKTMTFNGTILKDNFSHAANTNSKLSFEASGQMAQWEAL